jgi:alpha-glucoside transport system substrate-binding protein
VHLTREEFEKFARPHLERTAALTLQVLADAGVPPEDVGAVFLVGGSSRIPLAATLLHRTLRIAPTVIDQPELVVAEGSLHTPRASSVPDVPDGPVAAPVTAPTEPPRTVPPPPARPHAPSGRRPVRIVAAIALAVVVVTAAVLGITRPWRDIPGASSAPECANYTKFGNLSGRTVTVLSGIVGSEDSAHINSYKPFEQCTGVTVRYTSSQSFPTQILERARADPPPDLAYLPQPQLLQQLVATGSVKQAPPETASNVDRWFSKDWKNYGTVGGKFYAAPLNAVVKSLVWYSPSRFRNLGYNIPTTLDELKLLSDHSAARGVTPWCAGIESDAATGWVVTDWVEEFLLRLSGPAEYDRWVAHAKPFNSAESIAAFDAAGAYLKTDGYVNGGHGGVRSIATTSFQNAGLPILENTCLLHRQADFYEQLWPRDTKVAEDGDVFAFHLPGTDAGTTPVLGAGELAVAFADRSEVRAFQTFLSSDWWASLKAAQGGSVVSANTGLNVDQCAKCTPIDRLSLRLLQDPRTVFRFDGSDQMPASVGAGTFWKQGTNWINGQSTRQTVDAIEASWPR